jgi:hypothetical protein
MTEAEQFRLTRWGIPGWTAILSAFAFAIIDIALASPDAPSPLYTSITDLFKSATAMSAAVAALLAAAAGVPLGFCIYQAYFWLRWNSPVSRDGFLPPLVVGRQDDLDRTMRDFTETQIARAEPWRERWVSHPLFRMDHGWRWRYIENVFTEAAQCIDSRLHGVSVFARHRHLLDLMHTLGAALAGIYLGYLGYLLAKAKLQSAPFTLNLVLTALPLALLVVLLDREDHAIKALESLSRADTRSPDDRPAIVVFRRQLGRRLHISLRVSHPSVMFLFLVASFLYLASPSPYLSASANPLPLRLLVLAVPVVAWYFAKRKAPRDIRLTESVLLALSIPIAYLAAVSQWLAASSPDWPFYWSILAFLLANLAFLKNRQNVRDDLIALEYFTLRRFFHDTESQGQARCGTGGV